MFFVEGVVTYFPLENQQNMYFDLKRLHTTVCLHHCLNKHLYKTHLNHYHKFMTGFTKHRKLHTNQLPLVALTLVNGVEYVIINETYFL